MSDDYWIKPKGLYCTPDCLQLNITEEEQDKNFAEFGTRPEHRCIQFQRRVMHFRAHPLLCRLPECIKEYGD